MKQSYPHFQYNHVSDVHSEMEINRRHHVDLAEVRVFDLVLNCTQNGQQLGNHCHLFHAQCSEAAIQSQ